MDKLLTRWPRHWSPQIREQSEPAAALCQVHLVSNPEYAPAAVRNLFEGGSVVKEQGIEPALFVLIEGKRNFDNAEPHVRIVIGEGLDFTTGHCATRPPSPLFLVLHQAEFPPTLYIAEALAAL